MSATTNSKRVLSSKKKPAVAAVSLPLFPVLLVALLTALASMAAVAFFYSNGSLYFFGDAESHLNIARRVLDSRTPGYDQLGTTWLPLPHLLMLPFVGNMRLWKTGLAGSIPSGICFVAAACFLFATARRVFASTEAAVVAVVLFVINPNALYLQSTAMTEPVFFCGLLGLLYCTVAFQQTRQWRFIPLAGVFAAAAALTRYEGWFLLPFTCFFFLLTEKERRLRAALLFGTVAALGPLTWLTYNWWVFDNALEFYNGSSSALAIQGGKPYPGFHDWRVAAGYFAAAGRLCVGTPLFWVGLAGIVACARKWWPLMFLSLPPIFYIWSVHSSGTPIFLPQLASQGWYNTRYGLALLPLFAFTAAAIAGSLPKAARFWVAALLVLCCAGQWALFPRPESWITWKESQINSESRRAWTAQAVSFLSANYRAGDLIFTTPGDVLGIYRRMGIPFRRLLTIDNGPQYVATVTEPGLFLWGAWSVAFAGDPVQTALDRARLHGPKYQLAREIYVPGAPVLQIYRRASR